jgi:predicted PurR-regulated permease PerM
MCLLLLVIVILPTVKLLAYAGDKSVDAYNATVAFFNTHDANDLLKMDFFNRGVLSYLNLSQYDLHNQTLQTTLLDLLKQSSDWLLTGATIALEGSANFVISLALIIIALFFFFVDGQGMLDRLMALSPLPDRYNQEIFRKFRAVSYSTFLSNIVAALAQGIVGAIGFGLVGWPPLLAGALIAIISLLPIGSALFYVPVGLFYLLTGDIWQGVFSLVWGVAVISTVDNLIRTYMVKGKAEINPVFVLFSLFGGIALFGFWGVILGPLIVALAVTVLHIYELEFCEEEGKEKTAEKLSK